MSQRYLQERSLSSHRQVHGCTLCSRKGWSVAAEGHTFNSVPESLVTVCFPLKNKTDISLPCNSVFRPLVLCFAPPTYCKKKVELFIEISTLSCNV